MELRSLIPTNRAGVSQTGSLAPRVSAPAPDAQDEGQQSQGVGGIGRQSKLSFGCSCAMPDRRRALRLVRALRWGVMHGRLSPQQANSIWARFRSGQLGGNTPQPSGNTPSQPTGNSSQPTGNPSQPTSGTGASTPTSQTPSASNPATTSTPATPSPVQAGGGTSDAMRNLVRSQLTPAAQAAFDRLGSKLDEKDLKTGRTMLENLNDLAQNGVSPQILQQGVTKKAVLSDLVQELDNPGLIHQSDHGTCGATTAQYLLASKHPAEYARVVSGLMQGNGAVALAGGGQLQRDSSSIAPDFGTRNNVDRMFQTAEMENSELGRYDNRTDSRANGLGGLTQDDVTTLANQLTGGREGNYQTVTGNDSGTIQAIQNAANNGSPVPVGMHWSAGGRDAYHELLVTKIENGKVYLRNPWGQDESGNPRTGPSRQVVDGTGDIVVSLSDFQRNLVQASLASR